MKSFIISEVKTAILNGSFDLINTEIFVTIFDSSKKQFVTTEKALKNKKFENKIFSADDVCFVGGALTESESPIIVLYIKDEAWRNVPIAAIQTNNQKITVGTEGDLVIRWDRNPYLRIFNLSGDNNEISYSHFEQITNWKLIGENK